MVAAAIVTAIFVARLVAAFLIETPRYFPDEYFYTALSRSLWNGSFPSIRGEHVEFVSLLAPLVFAPAWLVDNVDVAYRIAQTEGVLAIALAALPAYILAARIGLGDRSRVAAAVFAVAVPDAVYGGFMLSEPFAYPLFLTGVLLAVETLAAPTARKQVLFSRRLRTPRLYSNAVCRAPDRLPLCGLGIFWAPKSTSRRSRAVARRCDSRDCRGTRCIDRHASQPWHSTQDLPVSSSLPVTLCIGSPRMPYYSRLPPAG